MIGHILFGEINMRARFVLIVRGRHRRRRDDHGAGAETIQSDGRTARGQEARIRALCAEQSPLRRRTGGAPGGAPRPPPLKLRRAGRPRRRRPAAKDAGATREGSRRVREQRLHLRRQHGRRFRSRAAAVRGADERHDRRRHPDQVAEAAPEPVVVVKMNEIAAEPGEGRRRTSAGSSISASPGSCSSASRAPRK